MDLQMKTRPMVMTAFKGHCQPKKHKATGNILSFFIASNHYINFKNIKQISFPNFPIIFIFVNVLKIIFAVSSLLLY